MKIRMRSSDMVPAAVMLVQRRARTLIKISLHLLAGNGCLSEFPDKQTVWNIEADSPIFSIVKYFDLHIRDRTVIDLAAMPAFAHTHMCCTQWIQLDIQISVAVLREGAQEKLHAAVHALHAAKMLLICRYGRFI